MMKQPTFLTLDEILTIHHQEISAAGGSFGIRDMEGVKASVDAPKASFGGEFLLDIFGMAATYISSLALRHPFIDGNKRVALASALTFLYLNGFEIDELYPEELADKVLDFVTKEITKEELQNFFAERCRPVS